MFQCPLGSWWPAVRWLITISAIAQMLRVCSMSIRSLNSILLPYLDASRLYNCPGKYPVHTNIYSSFLLRHEKEISKRSVEHDCKFQLWSHDIDEVKKSELQKTPETKTTNSKHVKICRLSSPPQMVFNHILSNGNKICCQREISTL